VSLIGLGRPALGWQLMEGVGRGRASSWIWGASARRQRAIQAHGQRFGMARCAEGQIRTVWPLRMRPGIGRNADDQGGIARISKYSSIANSAALALSVEKSSRPSARRCRPDQRLGLLVIGLSAEIPPAGVACAGVVDVGRCWQFFLSWDPTHRRQNTCRVWRTFNVWSGPRQPV
jgi:hypothetical protein